MTPDINVLLAAFRSDHVHHTIGKRALTDVMTSRQVLVLLPQVVYGFIRVATNERIFGERAASSDEAITFISALLATPKSKITSVGREWTAFADLCRTSALNGNAVPDAWIAACVLHLNEHLLTFDRDFLKLLPKSRVTLLPAK